MFNCVINEEDGRVIGGLASDDPFTTTYQEYIDKKPSSKPQKSSPSIEEEETSDMADDNLDHSVPTTSNGVYSSYLNRYTSQRVMSKSMLTKMGKSLQSSFN